MWRSTLKLTFKVLQRRKFFTAISVFCIVFTLVVLLVVTALLDHMLVPAAPEIHASRTLRCPYLVMSGETNRSSGNPGYLFLDRYVRPLPGAESVTLFSGTSPVVTYLGERKLVSQLRHTDAEYWRTLRFRFLEGGPFDAADDKDGRAVVVINEATRRRLFGEGAQAMGRSAEFDGQVYRIVGVVENVPVYLQTAYADAWAPIGSLRADGYKTHLMGGFDAIVLAKTPGDISRLKAEFAAVLPRVEMTDPARYTSIQGSLRTPFECFTMDILPIATDPTNSRVREFILAITVAALLFMSLPAMNLVNINISRILERSAEIGVRKAFGASAKMLVAQLVFENVVLCVLGGLVSLGVAWFVLRGIESMELLPYAQLSLNLRIFGAAVGLAVFFGLLSGAYPAWRMSRLHPVAALRGGVQ